MERVVAKPKDISVLDDIRRGYDSLIPMVPDYTFYARARDHDLSQIERLLEGDPGQDLYAFVIEEYYEDSTPCDPLYTKMREVVQASLRFIKLDTGSYRESSSVASFYKTKLPNIFVSATSVIRNGILETEWVLHRIDPGREDNYPWLPKNTLPANHRLF